jgi:hypothetical protein
MLLDMQKHQPNPYFRLGADAGIASIFIDDWLYFDGVAVNSHLGIPYVIETMKYLNSKSPWKLEFDNIAIGTDFDGLATNPKDLYLNRQLADLVGAMKRTRRLNPNILQRLCMVMPEEYWRTDGAKGRTDQLSQIIMRINKP